MIEFVNRRAGSVLSELDSSLLTDPTHLYPPGGGRSTTIPHQGDMSSGALQRKLR